MTQIATFAPGRVNLMGDHTDTTGGLVLPMAIDLGTTVVGTRGGERVELRSDAEHEPAIVGLDGSQPPDAPAWAAYVAGVVAEVAPQQGLRGHVTTTLPVGAGLSSSASLELAVALALGAEPDPRALALLGQRAEQAASGVPCGIMDQLTSAAGVACPAPSPAPRTPTGGGSARRLRATSARCDWPDRATSGPSTTPCCGAGPATC